MTSPEAALNLLLDNLSQVLRYKDHLIADVMEYMVALLNQLTTLKGLMKDFPQYAKGSEYLRRTEDEIRRILGQAEDAVDTFLLQRAVRESKSWVSNAFPEMTDYPIMLREVATQIEAVCNEVRKINEEEKVNDGFEVLQYQPIVNLNRAGKTYQVPEVEEDHVIGFDGVLEDVKRLVTEGPEHYEVISIVGMLGLGKTTLAKKVYSDPHVEYEYMIRAFVYISQEYMKKDVYLKILSSFEQISDKVNAMTEKELEKHLYKLLEGKQYLVVLDDVWGTEDWDELKDAFPKNKKRCRVLITTRNERMAEHANPENLHSFYRLRFLTIEDSRKLLHWRVFDENICPCPLELQEYEFHIAMRCHGSPFAILIVAGLIRNHPENLSWWRYVANSLKDYIVWDIREPFNFMNLMYQHLPNHLKLCFLYLGVFPEDFEIPVWKLVRLWISEGLIQQVENLNLEDMAEQYLEELVHRNLMMVQQRRSNNCIKTCRMHGVLHYFCKRKAIEGNHFQEIKQDELELFLTGNPILAQYRRICINNANVLEYVSGTPSGKCVRSFLTFPEEEVKMEQKYVFTIPKRFKLLRVLEIQSLHLNRFPVDICNLVLLRYLAISSKFWSLPPAISTLWNLQTLIVNTSSRKVEIEVDIWKMPQFRHLHTNRPTILPCPDAENKKSMVEASIGKNVQTLSTITPESCRREILKWTPKLKKLGFRGSITKLFEVNGESSLFENLFILECLENLKLLNDDDTSRLLRLPSFKCFPRQLRKLTLFKTFLDWKEMSTLGKLENLEVIKLKEYAFEGKLWLTEKGGFPCLRHLHIGRTDLVVWEASVDDFPMLHCLKLYDCEKLQALPLGFADLPSLQSIVLHCTNARVVSSARKIQVLKLQLATKRNKNLLNLSVFPPEY